MKSGRRGGARTGSCNPTLRCLSLYFLEFSAHRRVVTPKWAAISRSRYPCSRYAWAIPVFPSLAKIRSNVGLLGVSCARGIELLILGRLPVNELVAAQVNLTFELIPRPLRYPVSDKFPISVLRYTPV